MQDDHTKTCEYPSSKWDYYKQPLPPNIYRREILLNQHLGGEEGDSTENVHRVQMCIRSNSLTAK